MKQKNFKEIYDSIYASFGQALESKRKTVLGKKITAFIIGVCLSVVIFILFVNSPYIPLIGIIIVLIIIIIIFALNKINKDYILFYKEKAIKEIVKQSNPNLTYCYDKGISSNEYAESKFDFGWDRYHTEDLIEGTLEDGSTLRMAQVHTEEEHTSTDSDGHTTTTYVTTFLGLYGIIGLKTATRADFMIKENSKFAKFNKNRIEMESAEFEKYYDVYTNNITNDITNINETIILSPDEIDKVISKDMKKINTKYLDKLFKEHAKNKDNTSDRQNAMEILTPEAIEEFVKIRNIFKKPINVRVSGDMIYFRIAVGDIFEPPTFKSSINFDMLRKYFLMIDVPRMLYETLIDSILVMYGDQDAKENRNISKMSDAEKKEYMKNKQEEEESTYFSHN